MKTYWQQVLTELRLYTRSVGSMAWSFIFPVFVIFSLGFYFSNDTPVKQFIGFADEDQTVVSHMFSALLQTRPDLFTIVESNYTELDSFLAAGRISALIRFPAGLSDAILSHSGTLEYRLNPYLGSTQPVLPLFLEKCVSDLNNSLNVQPQILKLEQSKEDAALNGGSYVDFLIPGMIGLQVMSACLWGIGFLLINYREKGNLKQLALTPVRKSVYIAAFISSRFVFQIVQILFILVSSFLVFPVHMQGNWTGFMLAVTLGCFMFMSLGFLIASLADTIELAIGINNILFFLMVGLGGVFFSTSNLPEWIQWVTEIFPLTHFIQMLRGIFNDGLSFFSFGKEIIILLVWTIFCFALSMRYFRWY